MNKPNHRRYTNHGHLLKKTKPPIAKGTAIPFLFDGIQMTGFKTPVDDTRRLTGTNMTGLATPTKEQTQLEEYAPSTMSSSSSCVSYAPTSKSPTTPTTPTTRNTYLSNLEWKSPGPRYNTSLDRHQGAAIVWQPLNTPKCIPSSSSNDHQMIVRNICTPSATSKARRALAHDWSSSKVDRFKGLTTYSSKKIKRRTVLPWGNKIKALVPSPCVFPRRQRFHQQDDRSSSIGGNHVFQDKTIESKLYEMEAHLLGYRENIWKTLRPRGVALLNFPKTLHEQLAEKKQRERTQEQVSKEKRRRRQKRTEQGHQAHR